MKVIRTRKPFGGSRKSRDRHDAALYSDVRCSVCKGSGWLTESSGSFNCRPAEKPPVDETEIDGAAWTGESWVYRCTFCIDGRPRAICGDCGEALPMCACFRRSEYAQACDEG
jgi:hypothetical protein